MTCFRSLELLVQHLRQQTLRRVKYRLTAFALEHRVRASIIVRPRYSHRMLAPTSASEALRLVMTQNFKSSSYPYDSIREIVRDEMRTGIDTSRDPANANLSELAARTTTIYSPWYMHLCLSCRHKIRDGDLVRLCPLCGSAYHDDDQYRLYCWQKQFADGAACQEPRKDPLSGIMEPGCPYKWGGAFPDSTKPIEKLQRQRISQISSQFLRGIEAVWRPYGHEPVFEVDDSSPTIGFPCQWCRSQIRAGDRVVRCPCGKCLGHFHNDIYRHLTCWNDWNGTQGAGYCPIDGKAIVRPNSVAES